MNELKQLRCPLCASRAMVYSGGGSVRVWAARCMQTECYAAVGAPFAVGRTREHVLQRWNDLVRPLWEARKQRALDIMAISLDDWVDA